MKFDPSKYFKNVEYCEYVWRKNEELGLGLRDDPAADDIQSVADMYEQELSSVVDRYVNPGFVENDLLLIEVVKEYIKEINDPNNDYYFDEHAYDEKYASEKAHGAHGGYGYNDSYDDLGLDEVEPEGRRL